METTRYLRFFNRLIILTGLSGLIGCGELFVDIVDGNSSEKATVVTPSMVPQGGRGLSGFPNGVTILQSNPSTLRFVFAETLKEDVIIPWSIDHSATAALFEQVGGVIQINQGRQSGELVLAPKVSNEFYLSKEVTISLSSSLAATSSIPSSIQITLFDDRGGTVPVAISQFQLDSTFAVDGVFTSGQVGSWVNSQGTMIAEDSQKRILVSGFAPHSPNSWKSDAAAWRLKPNGSIDISFGSNGAFFFGPNPYNRAYGLYVNADDSMTLIGFHDNSADSPTRWLVGSHGLYLGHTAVSFGAEVQIYGSARIPAGGYYGCGAQLGNYVTIVKYNASGAADTSFDGDGRRIFNTIPNAAARACALDSNGKLIVVGEAVPGGSSGTSKDLLVLRLNPNGTLDTSFAGVGYLTRDGSSSVQGTDEAAVAVLIGDQNEIYITGWANDGTKSGLAVWKYSSTGTPDSTFGNNGVYMDFTNSTTTLGSMGASLAFDKGGNLLIAGKMSNVLGTSTDMTLWHLSKTKGSILSSSSSSQGHLLQWTSPDNKSSWASHMIVDSEGRLLVVGGADDVNGNNRMKVWRFRE